MNLVSLNKIEIIKKSYRLQLTVQVLTIIYHQTQIQV